MVPELELDELLELEEELLELAPPLELEELLEPTTPELDELEELASPPELDELAVPLELEELLEPTTPELEALSGLLPPDEDEFEPPGGTGLGPPLEHPCKARAPTANRSSAKFFKVSLLYVFVLMRQFA